MFNLSFFWPKKRALPQATALSQEEVKLRELRRLNREYLSKLNELVVSFTNDKCECKNCKFSVVN